MRPMNKKKKLKATSGLHSQLATKHSSKKNKLFFSSFIFAFSFLLYANTLGHGYALDDDVVFLKNSLVQQGFAGIKDIFTHSFIFGFTGHNDQSYRPIVQVVYVFEKAFFGNNPSIQHFINVLLFSLSCLLLYKLLNRIFNKVDSFVPFVATILFAAHPIHTEVVANIKGLDEILNFIFLLFSLSYLITHFEKKNTIDLILSGVYFFLALLSKETAVTFLALIPLTIFFFTNTPLQSIVNKTFFFVGIFVIYFLIRRSVLDVVTFEEHMSVMNNSLAAATSFSDRIATAVFILGKYVLLLFFPHPLSWDYSFNAIPIVAFSSIKVIITVILLAAMGVYALIEIKKKNIFSYCILFFFITMSVVSNIFIMIGATLGERFLFIPSVAFCIAIAIFLKRFNKTIFTGVVAVILILFSLKTFSRNKDWKDNYSLFASGAESTPNSSRAQSALGSAYRNQAEQETNPSIRSSLYGKAISQYKKAVEILPEDTEALYNMGVCYFSLGDSKNALLVYDQTLKISPGYSSAANNAGVIYFQQKEYETAKKYFLQAIQYSPNNADALGNMGAINHNTGNWKEAIEYYKKALQLNPGNQSIRDNLEKAERVLRTNIK